MKEDTKTIERSKLYITSQTELDRALLQLSISSLGVVSFFLGNKDISLTYWHKSLIFSLSFSVITLLLSMYFSVKTFSDKSLSKIEKNNLKVFCFNELGFWSFVCSIVIFSIIIIYKK